ncbi:hypothetical protein Tco_0091825 [Tanacetum coccineum]
MDIDDYQLMMHDSENVQKIRGGFVVLIRAKPEPVAEPQNVPNQSLELNQLNDQGIIFIGEHNPLKPILSLNLVAEGLLKEDGTTRFTDGIRDDKQDDSGKAGSGCAKGQLGMFVCLLSMIIGLESVTRNLDAGNGFYALKGAVVGERVLSSGFRREKEAAGGNLLNRTPRGALTIIENKSKVRTSRNKPIISKVSTTTSSSPPDVTALTEIVKELVLINKANQQASMKAVKETCVTCGRPHPYYECLATDGNTFNASAATRTYNQGGNGYHPQEDPNYRASNQIGPPSFPPPNV